MYYLCLAGYLCFNSAKYNLNFNKSYLLPDLVNGCDIEPTVIRKANQFIPSNFVDVQLLDLLKFHGGATSLEFFMKAHKISETKRFFPCEWFDHPDKSRMQNLPPMTLFNVKIVAVTLLKQNAVTMLTF